MEKVRPWCGQPSDRGRLKIRSDQLVVRFSLSVSVVRHETLLILFFLSATLRFKQQLNNMRVALYLPFPYLRFPVLAFSAPPLLPQLYMLSVYAASCFAMSAVYNTQFTLPKFNDATKLSCRVRVGRINCAKVCESPKLRTRSE